MQDSQFSSIAGTQPARAPQATAEPATAAVRWQAVASRVALLAILLLSLALRLYNVNWDESKHVHPDERWITIVANDMDWPDNFIEALREPHNTPINPLLNYVETQNRGEYTVRKFAYGHLPLYLLMGAASALQGLSDEAAGLGLPARTVEFMRQAPTYDYYPQVGRMLSALFDTGTVLLLYLIGRRMYGRGVGLLAAALSAFTVTQIQLSHFYAFDPVATFFIVLAVYGAVRMVQEGRASDALIAGLGAGWAISSKFSALPILAPIVVAAVAVYWRGRNGQGGTAPLARAAQLLVIGLVGAVFAFVITSPFAILDWAAYKTAVIDEQGAMVRGIADFPFTRQYRGTTPFLYHIEQQVRWGMGWALGIVGFIGLAWAVARALAFRATPEEWATLAWVVPYFVLTGLFVVKFMRYMLPVVPFLTLFGAAMLVGLYRWAHSRPRAVTEAPITFVADGNIVVITPGGGAAPSAFESLKPLARVAAPILVAVTVAFTVLYALAFMAIYRSEHTWIQASKWMYENVPDGSTILWEYWDDPLPLGLPLPRGNPGEHGYNVLGWGAIEEDTPQKFEQMKAMLREADYISFSSKRIYGALARLPERYPMTNEYYRLLFAGELGFELAAEVTSYPQLGSWVIDDHTSDESFTLYDHPRVLIFRKVRDLSDEEWNTLLGGKWEGARAWYTGAPSIFERIRLPGIPAPNAPREATTEAESAKTLLLDQPVAALEAQNDYRWNPLAGSTVGALVTWWLILAAVGVVAWPVTFIVFRNLRDRGYLFARLVGWLVVAWFNWMMASLRLLTNSTLTLLLGLALLAVVSAVLAQRHWAEMRGFLRERSRLLLVSEAVLGGAFLFFVLIRLGNPDLWQPWTGGEKYMEFAFLNAAIRTPYFPPYDPYFANGYINYYYYGQYLVGVLSKLTGIMPSVTFNLSIASLFALTVAGAFSVAYSLMPRRRASADAPEWRHGIGWALAGGVFVALWGNIEGFNQVWRKLMEIGQSPFRSQLPLLEPIVRGLAGVGKVLGGAELPRYNFWDPSRVIPYTINEFPYWSFLFADLHPHMIGIPFTILFIALALNMVRKGDAHTLNYGFWEGVITFLMLPLTLGALAAINTWDLPTYLGLGVLAYLIRQYRARGRIHLLSTGVFVIAFGALAYLLYLPFFANYANVGATGIGTLRGKDSLASWLNIWAFFFLVAFTFIIIQLRRPQARDGLVRWVKLALAQWSRLPRLLELEARLVRAPGDGYVLGKGLLGLAVLAVVALLIVRQTVLAMLLLPLVGAGLLLIRRKAPAEDVFTAALIFTALALAAGLQVFFLKDFLQGGDFYRMNTLFKFFIQVWVLLGIAAAAALPRVFARVEQWRPAPRAVWTVAFGVLAVASLAFPLLGTSDRLNDRFPGRRPAWGTLDGLAFMTVGTYNWPDGDTPIHLQYDYEALQWLMANEPGVPVVAEVAASWYPVRGQDMGVDYYRAGGLRVSSITGLPTFIGQHQGEQRYGSQTGPREQVAKEFFNTTDIVRTQQILRELGIKYVYLGQLERIVFPPDVLAKFDQMVADGDLFVAFQNDGVTIYQVTDFQVTQAPTGS